MSARVVAQQWVSVDGYAAGVDGESVLFSAASREADNRVQRHTTALLEGVSGVLLGRRTYELFLGFWPASTEPMARWVNGLPKAVASTILATAPWGAHPAASVTRDAVEHARRHRAEGTGDLLVWGSLAVMNALIDAGQLDALDLVVAPLALGAGRPLLDRGRIVRMRQTASEDWDELTHLAYALG